MVVHADQVGLLSLQGNPFGLAAGIDVEEDPTLWEAVIGGANIGVGQDDPDGATGADGEVLDS